MYKTDFQHDIVKIDSFNSKIYTLFFSKDNSTKYLYIGLFNKGIVKYNLLDSTIEKRYIINQKKQNDYSSYSILNDSTNNLLFIGTSHGISELDLKNDTLKSVGCRSV